MASLRTQFSVGLFVVIGFIVAMVAILWLGLAENVKLGTVYVSYFDESVSGLSKDSDVKYLGVSVGKVESVNISPDSDLVEVRFRIEKNVKFKQKVYAQLETAGITGMKFIELDRQVAGTEYPLPKLDFEPDYPIIPTVLSSSQMLLSAVDRVLRQLEQLDVQDAGETIKKFVDNAQTTLLAIESLANSLHPAAQNLAVASSSAAKALDEAQYTLRSFRQNMGSIDRRSEVFEQEVAVTLQNVNTLLDELRNQPSSLIFSKPVPQRDRQATP